MVIAAQQAFYDAAAQVLPILLLVMAVGETRLKARFATRLEDLWVNLFVFIPMVLFVVAGEIAALRALAQGNAGETEHTLTTAGFAMGLTYLFLWFLRSTLDDFQQHLSPEARRRQLRLVLPLMSAFLCGIFFALR